MFTNYNFTAKERFLRYVQIDTQSDPQSSSFPSTAKQKDLSKVLADELKTMGLADAHMDEWGYVYATIPSNTSKKVPVICFCALHGNGGCLLWQSSRSASFEMLSAFTFSPCFQPIGIQISSIVRFITVAAPSFSRSASFLFSCSFSG